MLPDIRPGNTKILYFFNCLLDGMHTRRASFCDIYFDDLKMSGQHFALLVQNGDIFLSDLNSTNGTFVDGKPVEAGPEVTVPVANGSTIEAGSVTFVIRW